MYAALETAEKRKYCPIMLVNIWPFGTDSLSSALIGYRSDTVNS